jgi:hypothetical protein
MKTFIQAIVALAIMSTPCHSFVAPIEFAEKCGRSDAILRCVVIHIVTVAGGVRDSRGSEEDVLEGEWTGPSSVAVARVVRVIKGDSKKIGSIILIPCGYGMDESPCELTESKDYILFLESMGRNYFHPLGPFCIHRVQQDSVGMSGFDWEGDFDPDREDRETATLEEFIRRIKKATGEGG